MAEKYKFQDEYLGLSDDKIHCLRNRFEYDSILISEFAEAEIRRGKSIKNWMLLLILGAVLLFAGLFLAKNIFNFLLFGIGTIYIEEIIFPFFMILIGTYFCYKSLSKELIVEFKNKTQSKKFSLEHFKQTQQLDALIEFLETKIKVRKKV